MMRPMRRTAVVLLAVLLVLAVFALGAGTSAAGEEPEGEPVVLEIDDPENGDEPETEITAERITFDGRRDLLVAEGDVVIKRNGSRLSGDYAEYDTVAETLFVRDDVHFDDGEDFRLWSDELEVELEKELYLARGGVRIELPDIEARADKAVYTAGEDLLELTGDPVAHQRGNTVSADKITVYTAEERMVAEGRTRTVIREEILDDE